MGRVPNGKIRVLGSENPNQEPMVYMGKHIPTAMFALDLDVPESRFNMAEQVLAEIELMEDNVQISTEIVKF